MNLETNQNIEALKEAIQIEYLNLKLEQIRHERMLISKGLATDRPIIDENFPVF